ncbi:MAG: glycerophosphodiester phosphodiesterase family protein [Verrucomicrobia bacterium]|nr:glycerophosphodiester phosphodiesterase family protein [Verrucomicrobiota bacterium]
MKIQFLTLLLGLTSLLAVAEEKAVSAKAKANWNVTKHIPFEQFILQSHRGAGVLAPENTIEAFELGWKLGTYPEADIRTTKDGVIVAFHDANFSRVVKGASEELKKKGVQDLTFAELGKIDVGSWHGDDFEGRRVSRISEIFELMRGKPDRHLYLDIKNVDLRKLADEAKAGGVAKQVILASRHPEIIREWKSYLPESDTLLWMSGDEKTRRERLEKLKQENFDGITQVQIHIHLNKNKNSADPFTPSNAFIIETGEELRRRNILYQALPYTDDLTVYAKLLDLGLGSFSTDYPDATMREIKAYYEKHGRKMQQGK